MGLWSGHKQRKVWPTGSPGPFRSAMEITWGWDCSQVNKVPRPTAVQLVPHWSYGIKLNLCSLSPLFGMFPILCQLKNKSKIYWSVYRLRDVPELAQMIGASLQTLPPHLCDPTYLTFYLLSEYCFWQPLWPFKTSHCAFLLFQPFASMGCINLWLSRKGPSLLIFLHLPMCWACSRCSAVKKGDPDLTQLFLNPTFSCFLPPPSHISQDIPRVIYQKVISHSSKDVTYLKAKQVMWGQS